jgi:hypothetical protein
VVGSSTFRGQTNNGTAVFNSPVIANATVLAKSSMDVSGSVIFRSSLDVLGDLNVSENSQFDSSLNILGALQVAKTSQFDSSLNVLGALNVSNNVNITGNLDTNGTMTLRNSTNSMSIYYDAAYAGFRFINNNANGYMYFSTKDSNNNIKNFQFNASQVYCNLLFYIDNWLAISYNKQIVLGDANSGGVWYGASMKYVPNGDLTSGLVFYNRGVNNGINGGWCTNFTHNNLSNVETPTLRMNYANIWSKVKHTFENGLDITSGNMTLSTNLIANSTTITPVQLSYISGATSNIQTQLDNKLNLSGGTITGNLIITGNVVANSITITPIELGYISGATSNIQTQLNNKASLSNNTFTGTNTFPSISFTDSTQQTTAFTSVDEAKLNAIGTINTSLLVPTFIMASGTLYELGLVSLVAGTYIYTLSVEIRTITGTTSIAQCTAGASTSNSSFSQSQNLAQFHGNSSSLFPVSSRVNLNTSGIIAVGSTSTYYLVIRCSFGTASRLQFMNDNLYSQFRFTKLS